MSYSDWCIICGKGVNKEEKHWEMEQYQEIDEGRGESVRTCDITFYICNDCGEKLIKKGT